MYVATAQPGDTEMAQRIAMHRAERPAAWQTLEAPHALARALRAVAPETVILIDCLTLWLSNALLREFDEEQPLAELPGWRTECTELLECLEERRGTTIMVSNEVGSGIVPMSALARRFQDEQGRLNQRIAAVCERVTLVVAGITVPVKSPGGAAA